MAYDRLHFVKALNSDSHKCEDTLINALCSANVFSMPSLLEDQLSTQSFLTQLWKLLVRETKHWSDMTLGCMTIQ